MVISPTFTGDKVYRGTTGVCYFFTKKNYLLGKVGGVHPEHSSPFICSNSKRFYHFIVFDKNSFIDYLHLFCFPLICVGSFW